MRGSGELGSEGLGLGSEVIKWCGCGVPGAAMGGAVMGRCLVTGGLAPGLALSESESADSVTAVAQGLRRSASQRV